MLARYKIVHELGRGATGAVYAARDRTTGALVALKRLDPALLGADAGAAARFLARARAARQLRHPNIVQVHEAGEAAGTAYVATELLEGESLRKLLDDGPLPVGRAIRIAHEVASGLAHAHLEGVIHAGLKPSNVLVLRSGGVKITDFGTGQAGPAVCPEQTRGEPVDHRCDIFSLGAVFYEMLTRQPPREGAPPPPSELNPNVPRALDAVVLSMLAAQPAARMPGVPILLRELERIEEGLGVPPTKAEAEAEPEPPPKPEPGPRMQTPDPRDLLAHHMAIMERREPPPQRPSSSRPLVFAALGAILAALVIGLADFMGSTGFVRLAGLTDPLRSLLDRGTLASPTPDAPLPPVAEAPKAETPKAETPKAEEPKEVEVKTPKVQPPPPPDTVGNAKTAQASPAIPPAAEPLPLPPPPPAAAPEPPAAAPAPPTKQLPRAKQAIAKAPAAKAPAQQAGPKAQLILAVEPRGELYIDGEHHGTTPPLTTLHLEPGMHRIEVRSGSRKPYLTYMTLEAGDVRRIRHDFNAKRIRPPG